MSDDVRKQSPEAIALNEHCELIKALMGGTKTMRAAGKTYLPKWEAEDEEAYKFRAAVATLFPAYQRTVEVLASKPFSKPLTYGKDVPKKIEEWCANADKQNNNFHAFLSEIGVTAFAYGFSSILVDFPPTRDENGNALYPTQADEQKAGVRPYLVPIETKNILGWEFDDEGMSQLRLLECIAEKTGRFSKKKVEQVRVLERGKWEIWRKPDESKDGWTVYDSGTTTLTKIPFVPVYGYKLGEMKAKPGLLELAYANVEHWQTKSDRQINLHMLSVPILFAKMIGEAKIVVGPGFAVKAADADADMKFIEMSGTAAEAGRQVLLDLEDQMRQAGAELLIVKSKQTVAQTVADNEQGACALQKVAVNIQDAADQVLQLMADWVGEKEGGSVSIFKDFGAATLQEASAELLFKSASGNKISGETYFKELQRRGLIAPELKWEEEVERIAAQGPSLADM